MVSEKGTSIFFLLVYLNDSYLIEGIIYMNIMKYKNF